MISVIIPTYKNKELFLANLKHNLSFLKACEIIVVNDDPEESLKDELSQLKIFLIENKEHLGFAKSVNIGAKSARNKLIMLLNNDVLLNDENYKKAINYFKKDKKLFAVSFAQKEKDGTIVGKNKIYWKKGMFMHERVKNNTFGETGWAEGGSSLVDRDKFIKLGGFDSIYSPFYWEDIDLSYRAKEVGYQIIFDPKIEVTHHHESTIAKYYSNEYIQKTAFRNQLLFIWKNIDEPGKKINHFLLLPYHLLRYALAGKKEYLLGFIEAVRKYYE